MRGKFQRKVTLKSTPSKRDWLLVFVTLGLSIFGLVMVADVSMINALKTFGDQFYFFRHQLIWFILGLAAFIVLSFLDYKRLRFWAPPLLVITLFSLMIVLLPEVGIKVYGARRWLGVGQWQFQPAELAKITLAIYLASFFASKKKFFPFLIVLGLIITLIMLEPDLGTTVVVTAMALMVYFASGAPILILGVLGGVGILGGLGLILFSEYRRERLLTFFEPTRDPLGASYHIRQVLIALGTGGLFGVGLGQSHQKYDYLPSVATDSIFAVIGEELGLVGAVVLILFFLIFIWRGLRIAESAPDDFGRLLAVGITGGIGFQALVNLGAMVALVPLTGVPLPFISYGGTSLVLTMAGAGILVSISAQKVIKK